MLTLKLVSDRVLCMTISSNDSLGDRMKMYEGAFKGQLPIRMPVILRVDGKAFHTYTKNCSRPFDDSLIEAMNNVAIALCSNIQGAQMAYVQSDEISIFIHGYKKFNSCAWFDNEIQKMVSVSASIAAATMTKESPNIFGRFLESGDSDLDAIRPAYFDSRVFVLPESEVCNYFLWRQQDCSRNSIQMLARSLYSHKECNNKNSSELQEMCFQKDKNWNNIPTQHRRGRVIFKETYTVSIAGNETGVLRSRWTVDNEIPIFSENRDYINKYLKVLEE